VGAFICLCRGDAGAALGVNIYLGCGDGNRRQSLRQFLQEVLKNLCKKHWQYNARDV
jgi:hypothetical protein